MATKADIDKWIAAQGGPDAVSHGYDDVDVPDPRGDRNHPDYDRSFKDKKISTRRETWTNKVTGATYSATRTPFADDTFEDIKEGAATKTPAQQAAAQGQTTSTAAAGSGGKPYIDDDEKAGATGRRWGWNPTTRTYDRDLGPSPAAQEIQANSSRPDDPRPETNSQREARKRQEKQDADAAAVRNRPSVTIKEDANGNLVAISTDPVTGRSTSTPTGVRGSAPSVTVNGVTYERGPDGQYAPARGLPSEGQATAGGPPMPDIIVGAAEQALRAYHAALWKDPKLTPAQREKRFQEAVQVATLAGSQADRDQRERESQRNAEYNTATTKLNYLQSGMGQALDFALKLNGTLEPGSALGGKAFAALFGLQMIQMGQSGINSISQPGTTASRQSTPALTGADLRDPSKLAARMAEIYAHPVFKPAPPASVPTTTAGEPPARANLPAQPTTTAPATAARPDQTQVGTQIDNAIMPPAATPDPSLMKPEASGVQPNVAAPFTPPNGGVLPAPVPPVPIAPFQDEQREPSPLPTGEVTQVAPSPYPAIMAAYQPPPAPMQPAQPIMSPAVLHAQAASKPPWAMSEDEYNAYKAAGVPDDVIFSVPGRSAA